MSHKDDESSYDARHRQEMETKLAAVIAAVNESKGWKTYRPEHIGKKVKKVLEDALDCVPTGDSMYRDMADRKLARLLVCAVTGIRPWDYSRLESSDARIGRVLAVLGKDYRTRYDGRSTLDYTPKTSYQHPTSWGVHKTEREKAAEATGVKTVEQLIKESPNADGEDDVILTYPEGAKVKDDEDKPSNVWAKTDANPAGAPKDDDDYLGYGGAC